MKHYYSFIILLLSLYACQSETTKNVFSYADFANTKDSLTAEQIQAHITYIPLDTSKKAMFGSFQSLFLSEEYFFIQTPDGILQFNRQGKFLRTLCRVGRGPAECEYILGLTINNKNKRAYIKGFTSCLEFDFNGNFIVNHNLTGMWWNFLVTDNGELLANPYNGMGNAEDKLVISTLRGDTLKRFNNYQLFSMEQNFMMPYLSAFNPYGNDVIFRQQFSDTVFTFQPITRTLTPRYVFDFNGLGLTPEVLAKGGQALDNHVYVSELYEDSQYIYLCLSEKRKSRLYLIRKGENKIYRSAIRMKEYNNWIFKPISIHKNTLATMVSPENENENYVIVLLEYK